MAGPTSRPVFTPQEKIVRGYSKQTEAENFMRPASALSDTQKQQLVQVYDAAKAAGDTEAMEKVRSALAADAGGFTGDLRAGGGNQSMLEFEATGQIGKGLAAGVPEGLKRVWGGVQQLGGAVADAFGMFMSGKPYTGPDVRLANGRIIRGKQLDTSRFSKETAEEVLRQVVDSAEYRESVPAAERETRAGARDISAGATELGTLALAPEAALPRATTVLGALAANAAAGGLGGAAAFSANDDKGMNTALGAGLGPIAGVAFSLAPASRNAIGRALSKAANNPRVKSAIENARKTLKSTEFSLAQITGIPELVTLERAAYDSDMVEFFAHQTDNFVKDFVEELSTRIPAGTNLSEEFVSTRNKLSATLRGMHSHASDSYDKGMAEAARLARGADTLSPVQPREPQTFVQGGPPEPLGTTPQMTPKPQGARVPVGDFAEQFRVVAAEARRVTPTKSPVRLAWVKDVEQKLANGNGNLTVEQLANMLKDLTALQKGDDVGRALGTKLRSAIERDLDILEQTAGPQTDDAVRMVIETRRHYKEAVTKANALAESGAFKLLGVTEEVAPPPGELLNRFRKMDPERQKAAADYFRENALPMVDSMKAAALKEVQDSATTIRAASDSRKSLEQLTNKLFDPDNGYRARTEGLWSKPELEQLENVRDALRVISTHRPELKGAGTAIKIEDLAINVVSRSSEFIARQMTRILMSSKASQFFTDPALQKILMQFNRTTTGTSGNLLARAALLEFLQDEVPDEQPAGAEQGE